MSAPSRMHAVPEVKDKCAVCTEIAMCSYFDHDLAALTADRRGYVCHGCSYFVMLAEAHLHLARLSVPTDSIFENPL